MGFYPTECIVWAFARPGPSKEGKSEEREGGRAKLSRTKESGAPK